MNPPVKRKHVEFLSEGFGSVATWAIESEAKGFRVVRYSMTGNKVSRLFKSADDAREAWKARDLEPLKLR